MKQGNLCDDVRHQKIEKKFRKKKAPAIQLICLLLSGFWLLHCHLDNHHVIGMAVIIQVGDITEMQKKPEDFPRCGNWRMKVSVYGC